MSGFTVAEYKKMVPENAHLEGDALWDAMTEYMLAHPELQDPTAFDKLVEQSRSADPNPYKHMGIFIPMGNGEFKMLGASGPTVDIAIRWKDNV